MAKVTIGAVLRVIEYIAVAAYTVVKACKNESEKKPTKK